MRITRWLAIVGLVAGTLGSAAGDEAHHHHHPPHPGVVHDLGDVDVTPEVDPVWEAIQWLDRTATSVHCSFEKELKEVGAWPPRSMDRFLHVALCDFKKRAREIRTAARSRMGVQPWQISLLATAARNVEVNIARVELPCPMDQTLQDALDIAVYLEGTFSAR